MPVSVPSHPISPGFGTFPLARNLSKASNLLAQPKPDEVLLSGTNDYSARDAQLTQHNGQIYFAFNRWNGKSFQDYGMEPAVFRFHERSAGSSLYGVWEELPNPISSARPPTDPDHPELDWYLDNKPFYGSSISAAIAGLYSLNNVLYCAWFEEFFRPNPVLSFGVHRRPQVAYWNEQEKRWIRITGMSSLIPNVTEYSSGSGIGLGIPSGTVVASSAIGNGVLFDFDDDLFLAYPEWRHFSDGADNSSLTLALTVAKYDTTSFEWTTNSIVSSSTDPAIGPEYEYLKNPTGNPGWNVQIADAPGNNKWIMLAWLPAFDYGFTSETFRPADLFQYSPSLGGLGRPAVPSDVFGGLANLPSEQERLGMTLRSTAGHPGIWFYQAGGGIQHWTATPDAADGVGEWNINTWINPSSGGLIDHDIYDSRDFAIGRGNLYERLPGGYSELDSWSFDTGESIAASLDQQRLEIFDGYAYIIGSSFYGPGAIKTPYVFLRRVPI